ncbi:myelin transcription factor 1-like protein [Anthonomus grandis grandis]|uniref:myelin transcription factor 1-like protein n=1 Tax=Anthonomus grandis grandis TaxID=2921223 RepID=UPI0021650150|nr:myelin transcription factor 1-like protein [Anthonomus grandis grandis]
MASYQKLGGMQPLTDKDLEEILNDSDFYLSDDDEEITAENSESIEAKDNEDDEPAPADADSVSDTIEEESDDDNVPLSRIREQVLQEQTKNKTAEVKWKRNVVESREDVYLDPEWQLQDDHDYWTPLNYFYEYFPDYF